MMRTYETATLRQMKVDYQSAITGGKFDGFYQQKITEIDAELDNRGTKASVADFLKM